MTKAAEALSRAIATRKARIPFTLNVNENARSVLDACWLPHATRMLRR